MSAGIVYLALAYLLGSIPTALLVSRHVAGKDIRRLGDGNMGAHNTAVTLGLRYGLVVAAVDMAKGALPVLLGQALGYSLNWRLLAAVCVVLGHDFPLFAGFRGGQGLAALSGALLAIMPLQAFIGLLVYLALLILFHNSDLGAVFGMGLAVALAVLARQPLEVITCAVVLNLSIPLKKWLDRGRRAAIQNAQEQPNHSNCHPC